MSVLTVGPGPSTYLSGSQHRARASLRGPLLCISTSLGPLNTSCTPDSTHPPRCGTLQYIADPFLINGYKFDMRIYVLVRCATPLRVFIHNEVRAAAAVWYCLYCLCCLLVLLVASLLPAARMCCRWACI